MERKALINQTIKAAMSLLKSKLQLLRRRDLPTLEAFQRWFGAVRGRRIHIILKRIRNHLILMKRLTHHHFHEIPSLPYRKKAYTTVYHDDTDYKILVGHPFWRAPVFGAHSKAGKLIQAFSHFNRAGALKDYVFEDKNCLLLAHAHGDKAMVNAENFARFIES